MNRPTVREVECFIAVAEEQSFTKAALRLNLSQPPLSRQIQSLEEKLGCRLLVRNTRSVALTPPGILFLEDCKQMVATIDRGVDGVRRAETGETSRLRLGFVGALMNEDNIRLFRKFRGKHSSCQIQLADLSPAKQMEQLLDGWLDGGFVGARPSPMPKGLEALVWKREPLLLVLPHDHTYARKPPAKFSQLRDERWVMVAREAAPSFRKQFEALCRKAGFEAVIVQETERVAAVLGMVAASQGISLLPASLSKFLAEGLVFHPFPKAASATLEHTFIYRPRTASQELLHFVALLAKRKF